MKRPWKAAAPANGPAPNSPSSLVRSKTGQESIRGRISSPIPIPNPLDEEFPMRNPGTGIASPLSPDAPEPKQEHSRTDNGAQPVAAPPMPMPLPPSTSAPPAPISTSASPDSDKPAHSPVPVLRAQPSPPRRAQTAAVRQSTMSVESGQTGSTKTQPQRKKSTLRGALGKLFGRKKKTISQEVAISNGKSTPSSSTQPVNSTQIEQKRSISLPVSQYDRALRSHSVGPEDVLAIESARNSLNVDLTVPRRRTGPGESYFVHTRRATDGGWMGLSPRPASSQGRGSRNDRHSSDPEDIGRAITCDTIAKRRRSRSLSGLPNVDEDRPGTRRRSDEIRYWRESYDPNFANSVIVTPNQEQNVTASPIEANATASDEPASTPLQPFAFGNIATMNELAGMKITQAVSMDTRIGNLEARMRRMEDVVTQLCNAIPDFKPQVETSDPIGTPAAATGTRPSTRHSVASRTSFGDATFVGSTTRSTVLPAPMPFHRPLSLATIRGATSLPTMSRDMTVPLTMEQEHYANLIQLVEVERAARQALEGQIKTLSHQIDLMARASAYGRLNNTTDPPPTGKSFGDGSAFDLDDDDVGGNIRARPYRGSMMLEDSGIATGVTDDDYSESFTTPYEEANGFRAVGDVSDDEDAVNRKTVRTMSLSQLTLGKGQQRLNQEPLPQTASP